MWRQPPEGSPSSSSTNQVGPSYFQDANRVASSNPDPGLMSNSSGNSGNALIFPVVNRNSYGSLNPPSPQPFFPVNNPGNSGPLNSPNPQQIFPVDSPGNYGPLYRPSPQQIFPVDNLGNAGPLNSPNPQQFFSIDNLGSFGLLNSPNLPQFFQVDNPGNAGPETPSVPPFQFFPGVNNSTDNAAPANPIGVATESESLLFGNSTPRTNFATSSFGNTTSNSQSNSRGQPPPLQPNNPNIFQTPANQPRPTRKGPMPSTASAGSLVPTPRSAGAGSFVTTPRSAGASSVTSGSTSRGAIEPLDRSTIVALVEGRGQARGEIGIACMNMGTPNLILSQFNDTQSYMRVIAKINIFRPYEILMSSTSCDPNGPSQLYQQLLKEVSNIRIIPIQRRIFNEAKGLQRINSLAAEEFEPIVHAITNKYYCLAATHALLKYIELMQSTIFSSKSLKIDFQGCDATCMIDHVTAQHLELLQNNQASGSAHSLLGILNTCKTPNGARLLRMDILQPTCDTKLINSRLDSVEELMKDREMLFGLQDVLGRLPIDIEHVIAFLIQIPKHDSPRITEQRINYVISLKHILELVPNLTTVLGNSTNDYFQSVKTHLIMPQYNNMLQSIKRIIHDEAQFQKGSMNMKRQRCFAVKADVNPILDIARKAYCELIDDINKYVLELSRQESISFRLGTNNQRGFYVQFFIPSRTDEIPPLPPYFLQVRKRGNIVTFTTEVLISLDHRAQEVLKEIEHLSSIVISELITLIRNDIGILYKVSEAIGNLDLIYALANYALTTPRSVRPEFLPDATSIRMGRHPILDSISSDPTVPNNTFLSNDANFMLITGPNMSGKTTYIKHVACLQVLAQVGSFVPADAAAFRIASNIMSRIGTGDNIEENSSSFALEMTEMTYILQNARHNSLIIIDELGRATSVEEGAAMSWAIAEKLLLSKKSFILFATHHMLLTKLESLYMNALNYTMETDEWTEENRESSNEVVPASKLQYTHVLKRGVTDVEYYGLKLAMNTCYPPNIIAKAIEMSRTIMAERGIQQSPKQKNEMTERRMKFSLGTQLGLAANFLTLDDGDQVNVEDVRHYLESLQEEFRTMMAPKVPQPAQSENDNGADAGETINTVNNVNIAGGNDAAVDATTTTETGEVNNQNESV